MPRHIREASLATREARKRLPIAKKPYYRGLDEGLHLGYRRSLSGSAWTVRWYSGAGKYGTANLPARPDDVLEADGETVLNWNQAQRKAREFFQRKQRQLNGIDEVQAGPYTIKDAMRDYVTDYTRRGGKSVANTQCAIDALILPALGDVDVVKLGQRKIEQWHEELTKTGPRLRTKTGDDQRYGKMQDGPDAIRRRRSTANRVLTILKAGLNQAHQQRKVPTDGAWRRVKPFREVDAARVRYLSDSEAVLLVEAAGSDLRSMVQAALLTGCRYGELAALNTGDYKPDAGAIHVRVSKGGKPRHVFLTDEGKRFFASAVSGKTPFDRLFVRHDGDPWGKSHCQRPFKAALKKAKLSDMAFHELRHTYASRLVMKGVPLAVVAAQLGQSDTRMVEKHYGHMAPSYVADSVRAAFTDMGISPPAADPLSEDD